MRPCARAALACAIPILLAGCGRRPSDAAADRVPAPPAAQATVAGGDRDAAVATARGGAADTDRRTAAFELPGRFTERPAIDTLHRWYGAANVTEGEVPGAEGETFPGAILFGDQPRRRAYVYLDGGRANMVRVFDAPSEWRLDNGIAIGTPLARVVELNGRPIRFYGLDWDYGGAISDWGGGALQPGRGPVRRFLQLGLREDAPGANVPVGDGEFSSDDPRYPGAGRDLVVAGIGVGLAAPGEGADAGAPQP